MIDYEEKEDDLVTLLATELAIVKVLPDNEAEFVKNFTKPVIYIVCTGSKFGNNETNYITSQTETVNFEAIIRSRSRRGTSGIFALIKFISEKLQGYKFTGCDSITLIEHGYVEGVQNDWNYVLKFQFLTKTVSLTPDPDVVDPDEGIYKLVTPEFK